MPLEQPDVFLSRITFELARRARDYVRPRIRSKVLSRSLRIDKIRGRTKKYIHTGYVEIPHYWAVYYHDGHGPISAPPGKYIVYYKKGKKHLDPRMQWGVLYPVRRHQEKRLSKDQFYRALRKGHIVVTKRSGPAKGEHFFTRGMRGFPSMADAYVAVEVKKWVDSVVSLGPRKERRGTAKIEIAL